MSMKSYTIFGKFNHLVHNLSNYKHLNVFTKINKLSKKLPHKVSTHVLGLVFAGKVIEEQYNQKQMLTDDFSKIFNKPEDDKNFNSRLPNNSKSMEDELDKEIVKRIVFARNALAVNHVESAEKALEKALEFGDKALHLPIGLTCAYEMLASISCQKHDINKAEKIVICALKKFKSLNYSYSDNLVISFSIKLARLYTENYKTEAAEIIFTQCASVLENKYYSGATDDETAHLLVNTLFWHGKLLLEKHRYKEAENILESCYHLSSHVKKIETSQVMVILNNLAEAVYYAGDKDKALRHLLHAVMLGRLTNFPDLPLFYIRIGNIYRVKGDLQEAKIWGESALLLSKKMKNKIQEAEAQISLSEVDKLLKDL